MKYENGKQIHGHSQSGTDSSLTHEPALDLSPHWQCVESCVPGGVCLHPDSGISKKSTEKDQVTTEMIKESRKPKTEIVVFLTLLTSKQ